MLYVPFERLVVKLADTELFNPFTYHILLIILSKLVDKSVNVTLSPSITGLGFVLKLVTRAASAIFAVVVRQSPR